LKTWTYTAVPETRGAAKWTDGKITLPWLPTSERFTKIRLRPSLRHRNQQMGLQGSNTVMGHTLPIQRKRKHACRMAIPAKANRLLQSTNLHRRLPHPVQGIRLERPATNRPSITQATVEELGPAAAPAVSCTGYQLRTRMDTAKHRRHNTANIPLRMDALRTPTIRHNMVQRTRRSRTIRTHTRLRTNKDMGHPTQHPAARQSPSSSTPQTSKYPSSGK
jgi:hypothetical protein